MEYRYETTSVTGFVQRVATQLLTHGYYFFVQGQVPDGKDPRAIDRKLLTKYEVEKTEAQRAWRKKKGLGNVHYVRFERSWLLLASHGDHRLKEEERDLRDAREVPIQFAGYSIYVKRGDFLKRASKEEPLRPDGRLRVRVLIGRKTYQELSAHLLEHATRMAVEELARELWNIPFEPYAPVRRQLLMLFRQINAKRKARGLVPAPSSVLRLRRRIVRAFEFDHARAAE